MGLSIGVLKETLPGERRVAITPKVIDVLTKAGADVLVEQGAGLESGFPDDDYAAKGAKIAPSAAAVSSIESCSMSRSITTTRYLAGSLITWSSTS